MSINSTPTGPTVASFFSGAGGLDKGFEHAGFHTVWANEFDRSIAKTFQHNFPTVDLKIRSISEIDPSSLPEVSGFIGGPPCQSWSEAGARRGIEDPRGKLFLDYVALLATRLPKFFVAENVSGFLFARNRVAREQILEEFASAGYNVSVCLLRASDYGVPQDRDRVFIVGYRTDLETEFTVPAVDTATANLSSALNGLAAADAVPARAGDRNLPMTSPLPNNHFFDSEHFSSIFMSRNRRRDMNQPSFTIQATASHAPLHPASAPMLRTDHPDRWIFAEGNRRRLSVRECARIQTFPDDFIFLYDNVLLGYKMVGNAVPVRLGEVIARQILTQIEAKLAPEDLVNKRLIQKGEIVRLF